MEGGHDGMTLQEAMESCGVDVGATLRRFGNQEALWRRFLLKFPQDPTFASLGEAVSAGGMGDVERAAHTLKGIAANLGFDALSQCSAALVEAVRSGEEHRVAPLYERLSAEHERVVDAIGRLD